MITYKKNTAFRTKAVPFFIWELCCEHSGKQGGFFCGAGGGTTRGLRTIALAKDVESQGAMGVVLNTPIDNLILMAVANAVDIPVIVTVVDEKTDIGGRIEAGANAITDTPPTARELFKTMMNRYREE